MNHAVFGPLTYDADDECWRGRRLLPAFKPYAVRTDAESDAGQVEAAEEIDEQELLGQMQAALDAVKDKMREKYGDKVEGVLAAMEEPFDEDDQDDEDDEDEFDDGLSDEEREQAEAEEAEFLRRGVFPIEVTARKETPPTPHQEAAFRHLTDHEAEVCRAVVDALVAGPAALGCYDDEDIEGLTRETLGQRAHINCVRVEREHHAGVSYLVFNAPADWEVEHGSCVVFHPAKGAEWTTGDGLYDLLESDEPVDDEEEEPQSLQILNALRSEGVDAARKLIADGADINDAGEMYPALWYAINEMEPGEVKLLLELGADPNKKPDGEKRPLKQAQELLQAFAPPTKGKLAIEMFKLAQSQNTMVNESRVKMEEIVRLLKAAGAK